MDIERRQSGPGMSRIDRCNGLVFFCGQTSSGTTLESIEDPARHVRQKIDALPAEGGGAESRLLQA